MKTDSAFDLGLQDYSVRRLFLEDIGAIQDLYEKCLDYMLLVEGRPADPDSVLEDFQFVPPGKSQDDKFVFGIFNLQHNLIGLLDVLRWYPDESIWWVGLLLLLPEARSHGMGRQIVQGLIEYVRVGGGRAIMLGVVKENKPAYRFWSRMGFELVRITEPRQFGEKIQTVNVMRRSL
jgi:GNAT superfamily N-acetyltransferase